jgi:hypothetical protein
MTSPFAALAARVDEAWSQVGYQADRLASIAAEALAGAALPASFDALADWLFEFPALPAQRSIDQTFGQPPVTVHVDDRFFIELLFWHTGTTGIHQHAFTGAFRVLAGSSLHTIYDFAPSLVIDERLALGELAIRRTEVLPTGAVRTIRPGSALIHSTFHLDNPSVTLVVRTHADGTRELEYKPPGLALDPAARDARTLKVLQLMDLLAQQSRDDYRRRVGAALDRCDAYTATLVLLRARRQTDPETFAVLLDGVAARAPVLAARLRVVADEELRRLAVTAARERIADPDHRFFLALVMNLPDRRAVLDAVAQRYPGRAPVDALIGWLRGCARRDQLGFYLDDTLLAVVRGVVEDLAPERIAARLRAPTRDIEQAIATLAPIAVLAPLFRDISHSDTR